MLQRIFRLQFVPKFFLGLYALCVMVMTAVTSPALALDINNVRVGVHPDKTRLVMDVSDVTDYRAFILQDPWRLVVDLPSFEWNSGKLSSTTSSGIKEFRHGALQSGISRIVVDLDQTHIIKSAFHIKRTAGKPPRLVIDIAKASKQDFMASKGKVFGQLNVDGEAGMAKSAAAQTTTKAVSKTASNVITPSSKPVVQQQVVTPAPRKKQKYVVVIDPGHGGADPGAIGANGVFEKNVVLAVAKDLKRKLERTGRYNVKMTREDDRFIRLHHRVAFARKHNADLFVSVHADAINKPNIRGASVYTLSEKASDAQTARLAARENKADQIAGVDLTHEDAQVADILVDLVMRDTMNQSNFFANTMVASIKADRIKMLENPHRSAGFAVLKAPDIPSVLVEVGFLSNRGEADKLSSPKYRQLVANSLKGGIDVYFNQLERNQMQ